MPKEVRYLLFSNEELYQALLNDLRARSQPLPRGFLKNIVLGKAENIDVTLIYVTDKGAEMPIHFENQEVLRSLIVYCGHRNIPLSAKAVKTIEIKDGMVGLLCTLNFSRDQITASGDKLSYQDRHSEILKAAVTSVASNPAAKSAAASPAAKSAAPSPAAKSVAPNPPVKSAN
jgi:hypothetical protein